MKTFSVTMKGTVYESFYVEANNVEDAIETATENFKKQFHDNVDDDSNIECEDYCEE